MKALLPPLILALAFCTGGLDLPDVPARNDFPVPSRVDRAYQNLLDEPSDPELNGLLGMVAHGYNDIIHAELMYRRAFLLDPDEFRWQYLLAQTQFALDQYDSAVNSYRRAARSDPDYTPARVQLLAVTFRMGGILECRQLAGELLEIEEAAPAAHYWLGRIAEQQRNLPEARKHYEAACERYPRYGDAHLRLGAALNGLGDSMAAREHFILADRHKFDAPPLTDPLMTEVLGPTHTVIHLLARGYRQENQNQLKEAEETYRRAVLFDPRSDAAHARLVSIYARTGQPADAMRHYQRAKDLDPMQPDAYSGYGAFLITQERYQEAGSTLDHALRLNPYNPEALMNRALLLEKTEAPEEAEALYNRAVECRPGYRDAHIGLGRTLVKLRRYEEAFDHFEAVVEREDSRTPELYWELASLYTMAGARSKAVECYRNAYELARKYEQPGLMDRIVALGKL